MRVLSLFDGMGCGREALKRAGIPVTRYEASEIDQYARKVAKRNHEDIIHIGDVVNVKGQSDTDLLIGGSPCQGFSNAGSGLNFDDQRSKLFFEFIRIKKESNPKYFLLENVCMKQEWVDIISQHIECTPVKINSSLFSAQSRPRLYWTNIPISPIIDAGIRLSSILETKYDFDLYNKKGAKKKSIFKSGCLTGTAHAAGNHSEMDVIVRKGEVIPWTKGGSRIDIFANPYIRRYSVTECERLQTLPDGYTYGVSNSQRYKMLINGWTVDVIAHIFKGLK